jgi:glycine/D-amino acid oxidase-like deaminating enzyme
MRYDNLFTKLVKVGMILLFDVFNNRTIMVFKKSIFLSLNVTLHPAHIIVVGASIVGASLAYHLAQGNVRVTLIDCAFGPGQNVTEKSFAWLTAAHDASEADIHFRQQAISDWHRLESELSGKLRINWCGALSWYKDMSEAEHLVSKLSGLGYNVRLIDSQEICYLEPALKIVPDQAIFARNEGALDPLLTTKLFAEAAREAGANIILGTKVLSLLTYGSRIIGVMTKSGNIAADLVVVATGTGTTTLCKSLGLQLSVNESPAILMKFHTNQQFVNRIVSNPFMEIRAASGNLLLAAEDYIDESAENSPQAIARRTLKAIQNHWQCTEHIELASVVVGNRAIPQDGHPVIGRIPEVEGLYLSVMHTGVTLAALAGRLAADEILSDQQDPLLAPYSPGRFT